MAMADMLSGVKGGARLGAPARLNRFTTTNLQLQNHMSTPVPNYDFDYGIHSSMLCLVVTHQMQWLIWTVNVCFEMF